MLGLQGHMSSVGKRIRSARQARRLTQAAVAKHFDVNRVSVTQWEGDVTMPEADKFGRLAKLLGGSPEWYLTGQGTAPHLADDTIPAPIPNAMIGEKVTEAGRKIPVYGQAVGGVDGEFLMNGNKLFDVLCPPSISPAANAYAVQISGESMEPRYFDGEIAFIDPKRRVQKGDFVVAQVQFEEHGPPLAYVKRFLRHNANELVLEQFNPAKELRFPHENVVSVHFVAMAGPS